ncbi:50S ribosomal protein L9 [Bacteriovorax sp. Seq25_V]|uniref:50S ribosomal protein L9 n=1 Tax=Bacteriovorax sp. Seq25_V TaxID=1201288 RepID=UPI00038A1900|nr:50S ribosomal protein L9 [Bacteriovorax sp. Seq25_V]EQC45658.1 ribosomal protein L9 [Bacteriovorax sp. Seq25_V]
MKVILKEKVKTLGNVGQTVNVSAGHARNFLIPNGLAVLADESNKAQTEHMSKILAAKVAEEKKVAQDLAKKVDGVAIEMIKRVGNGGKLFGSVTTQDLTAELSKLGYDVERKALTLDKPIKGLGVYNVKAKLFKEVEANFTVTVKMDPAQEEENKKKAEELAAQKQALAAIAAAEAEENPTGEVKELSEEEKLKQEANRILRG